MRLTIAFVFLSLFLGSCTTFKGGQDEADAVKLVSWLNTGDHQALTKASAPVFLLDQEVLTIPGDMESFWKALPGQAAGGYVFTDSRALDSLVVNEYSSLMEVRVFFKKHLDKDARLITVKNTDGKKLTFLVKSDFFSFKLFGMKGPY